MAAMAATAGALLFLGACGSGGKPLPGCVGPEPEDSNAQLVVAEQGLSAYERKTFYHSPEGSELLPVAWLRALERADSGDRFLSGAQRFGLLDDPENADGLPIGLTSGLSLDTGWTKVRMTGINCAACHVGELRVGGTRVRIAGAPNLFDIERFFTELVEALGATAGSWDKLSHFVKRLAGNAFGNHFADQDVVSTRVLAQLAELDASKSAGPLELALAERIEQLVADEQSVPAVDLSLGLAISASSHPTKSPQDAEDALLRRLGMHEMPELGPALSAALARDPAPGSPLAGLSVEHRKLTIKRILRELDKVMRLLKAKARSVLGLLGLGSKWKRTDALYGRVDAFGIARNILFPARYRPANAPVSYPHLWGACGVEWLHWDGNTNSLMERNLGQAIGLGAVFDGTGLSTLRPLEIAELDAIACKIEPPAWPGGEFGEIDREKALRGEALFDEHCASCHSDARGSLGYPVGTDHERLGVFADPIGGSTFADVLAHRLAQFKKKAYATFRIGAEKAAILEAGRTPSVWATRETYSARPLTAVWATAPYLHNGSVASIYELLLPEEERQPFTIGTREYDPKKLGYRTNREGGCFRPFDPAQQGNGNGGHEFGSMFDDDARYDLIEYLKTL